MRRFENVGWAHNQRPAKGERGGDTLPAGTFCGGDEIPPGTFH